MWQQFHELRVSDAFTGEWDRFFQESVHTRAQPMLYQYVSRLIFKELVKKQYAVCSDSCEVKPHGKTKMSCVTLVNMCAVRYNARLKNHHWNTRRREGGTETWTNELDRGGLWHISDETHALYNH